MARYGEAKGVRLKGDALLEEIGRQKEANALLRERRKLRRSESAKVERAHARALGRLTTGGKRQP